MRAQVEEPQEKNEWATILHTVSKSLSFFWEARASIGHFSSNRRAKELYTRNPDARFLARGKNLGREICFSDY